MRIQDLTLGLLPVSRSPGSKQRKGSYAYETGKWEDIFAGRYFRERIFSREDIFAGRYFRVNSKFAKISSRENISNSLFAKFSSRENKVLYTVEPLTNDHPHQRPSLSYDHISCDGLCILRIPHERPSLLYDHTNVILRVVV